MQVHDQQLRQGQARVAQPPGFKPLGARWSPSDSARFGAIPGTNQGTQREDLVAPPGRDSPLGGNPNRGATWEYTLNIWRREECEGPRWASVRRRAAKGTHDLEVGVVKCIANGLVVCNLEVRVLRSRAESSTSPSCAPPHELPYHLHRPSPAQRTPVRVGALTPASA